MAPTRSGSTEQLRLVLDTSIIDVVERLGFPAPDPISVFAGEHQVTHKLHACTTPDRDGSNGLVDLQILVAADPPDLHRLASIGRRLL